MKRYTEMHLQFHTFLTLALDGRISCVSWPLYPLSSDSVPIGDDTTLALESGWTCCRQ